MAAITCARAMGIVSSGSSRCHRVEMMKQIAAALILAVALAVVARTAPQDPQEQRPTFKSSIDLVPVDVSIVDKTGHPVTNLEAKDFSLTIDGRPRRIASAQYIPAGRDSGPAEPVPDYYSTNANAQGGRLIMFVVDQGNIGLGHGRLAMDGIARFISTLTPADRVGLVAIPGAGPQIDFTAKHEVVRALLPKLVGQATPVESTHRVGISEALDINRGDEQTATTVAERECGGARDPNEIAACRMQITQDANVVYQTAHERTRNSLIALRYLVERLAVTPSPKTVIFLSEGLIIDRDLSEVSWLGPAAARGQVVLYVMQLDSAETDASLPRASTSRSSDRALGEEGLGILAGMTRGTLTRIIASPDAAFARLGLELSGYYLVSFEPEPGDRDGKTHKIKVDLPGRKGVEIRARSEFTVDPPRTKSAETSLVETLRAPLLATEIGLKLSTYTLRDPASNKLRILVAAEIDRSLDPTGPMSLAYMLLDSKGNVVSSQVEDQLKVPIHQATKSQTYVGAALTNESGVHTIKLAVVDSAGKRGSVEHTFRAQLTSAGQVRATDLLIADNTGTSAIGLAPAVSAQFTSDTLHGYIELYSDSPEVLTSTSVVIEVAESEQGRTLDGGAARVQTPAAGTPNRRMAEASVPIALLPPGEYVARAVISINGRKSGQVVRPFTIARPALTIAASGANGKEALVARAPIPFSSRIDAFDKSAVLSPQVVSFFLDRMNVGPNAPPASVTPAINEAKAGRFDAAVEALKAEGNDQLAVVFLNGLALYSQGQLEAAAGKFREAIRMDSEFFPAVFYLGSCYAAGGRDREAVGAWQTSLVTESEAPFIYTLLGDALLRLRDVDQAVDILKEASTLWPDSEQVQLRLGTALAMAGQPAEALATLDPYLQKHPDDHERLFIVLRTLYEARASGRTIKSKDEDLALFSRYAAQYAAAKGPQQAIVDQWKKFMDKK
jgi:VWFA-related protein